MATISATPNSGVLTVTGSGYSGAIVPLSVAFTSTDNKRRTIELQAAPVSGGAISYAVPVPYSGGTVVVKTVDPTTATVLATSTGQVI